MGHILNVPPCNPGCECERCERGKRGKRGERGERGKRGHEGPTGPTGPTGPLSGAYLGRQKFTTDGTYVPTPGATKAHVQMCGGGASGTGTGVEAGLIGAGGGGASGAGLDFVVEGGGPLTGGPVVIGAGGAGQLGGAHDGTPTSVVINGTTYVADAGSAGGANSISTGSFRVPGGLVGTGSTPFGPLDGYTSGDNGGEGFIFGAGTASADAFGGDGGSGDYGIGGQGAGGSNISGSSATGYGAGGGGSATTATEEAGGSGAPGFVIIDEYT
jgi:hypothetical protein